MEKNYQLLIIAPDPLVRTSLAILFDDVEDFEVLLTMNSAMLLEDLTEEPNRPDLILWDMGWEMGDGGSLDFQELDPPVISLVSDAEQALEAWNAGARGILSREIDIDDMLPALRAAAKGLVVLDQTVTFSLLSSPPRLPGELASEPTERELEVLQLLAKGLTNRAIASQLSISKHTVKFHVNSLLKKFNAQSRTEAVVIATRLGFIIL
jgi:DNA-binding NarL/FixJ family response regulator